MSLLKEQRDISPYRGIPTDDKGGSSQVVTITGETVQLYYWNAGVRTADAGQLAGVVVEGKLASDNIKNSSGSMEGSSLDTSLAFTAGVFTTEVPMQRVPMESTDGVNGSDRAIAVTEGLANGEYVVDYSTGMIYGKKATTGTTLVAATYKIVVELSSSGSVLPSEVKVIDASGNQITSFGSPSTIADYRSPSDFTATYTSASTITLTGVPINIISGAQVVYIRVKATGATGSTNVYVNGASGYSFYYVAATGVLTALKDNVAASIFAASDNYEVGVNANTKGYDLGSDTLKVSNTNPDSNKYVADSLVDDANVVVIPAGNNAATFNIVADSEGRVLTAAVNAGGADYTVGGTLVVTSGALSGSCNNDCVLEVLTLSGSAIATVAVRRQGSNYVTTTAATTQTCFYGVYPSALGMSIDGYANISASGRIIAGGGATASQISTIAYDMTNDEDPSDTLAWGQIGFTRDAAGVSCGQTKNSMTMITSATYGVMDFKHSMKSANYSYFRTALIIAGAAAGNMNNTKNIKIRRNN